MVALAGAQHWSRQLPVHFVSLQSSRVADISESLNVLAQGGPPLIAAQGNYRFAVKNHSATPADNTDDPGIYLYLPVAGHLIGDHDPLSLFKWFLIGSMCFVLLAYPILFYLLFESLLVAVAAPLFVLYRSKFLFNQDIYFIQAWAVLLLLPLVLLVAKRRWHRWSSLTLLVLAALGASFANSVRSHAGTGVAIAAIAVAIAKEKSLRWRAGAAVIVVIGYILINPLGFSAVRSYSNAQAHIPKQAQIAGHPFWHPMYLGLGFLPNKWGIQWNDTIASNAVAKVDPQATFLSPRYSKVLRHLYFQIVWHDPGYIARVYATKAAIVIRDTARHFWLPLLLAPIILVAGKRRKQFRIEFALILPSLGLALLPPVLTEPKSYEVGFLGAADLISLLVGAGFVLLLRDVLLAMNRGARPRRELSWSTWRNPVLVALTSSVTLLGLGIAAAVASNAVADDVFYGPASSILIEPPASAGVVHRWDGASLKAWLDGTGATASPLPGGTLYVRTDTVPSANTLLSPRLKLLPGDYSIIADGSIVSGGLLFGTWGAKQSSLVTQAGYWSKQVGFDSERMVSRFTLVHSRQVRIAFANWVPRPARSTWVLRSIELVRAAPPGPLRPSG